MFQEAGRKKKAALYPTERRRAEIYFSNVPEIIFSHTKKFLCYMHKCTSCSEKGFCLFRLNVEMSFLFLSSAHTRERGFRTVSSAKKYHTGSLSPKFKWTKYKIWVLFCRISKNFYSVKAFKENPPIPWYFQNCCDNGGFPNVPLEILKDISVWWTQENKISEQISWGLT